MKVQLTRSSLVEHNAAAELARRLVTRPDCTFLINLGPQGVLVVDRGAVPREGSLMLMSSERGFALRRADRPGVPEEDLWGVVTWHIRRP